MVLDPANAVSANRGDGAPHGIVLSEVVHRQAWQVPPHGHLRPYFSFLVSGAYRERAAGFSLEYEPFTIVYHPASFEHADEIGGGGARFFTIEIPASGSGQFDRRLPPAGADRLGGRAVWLASALYREFRRVPPSELALDCHAAALEAEATHLRELREDVTPRWLERVSDRIHAQFRDKLRLDDLAQEAGVHPVHLSRTFARRRGVGLHDYIERVRVRWVCGELSRGEGDLAALAAEAGYADQSHMTRAFKRVTGMTPGELRTVTSASRSLARHAVPGFRENLAAPHRG
jgi:AraC family transcriptional regulator